MKRYAIWDKKSDILTAKGEIVSAENWIKRHPTLGLDNVTAICKAGEINGGATTGGPNGSVTVPCPNCHSTRTYVVRFVPSGRDTVPVFHCSDCGKEFKQSYSAPVIQQP